MPRDGPSKPVHRRILYAMYELGLNQRFGPTWKCAQVW